MRRREQARHKTEPLLIDPRLFEGESAPAPVPLGHISRRIAGIAALVPEQRPLDPYAALAALPEERADDGQAGRVAEGRP